MRDNQKKESRVMKHHDNGKQAEAKLREYERVVEGLEEMIAVVDRDYRYLIANPAFLNYRGLGRDQVIGHYVSEVLDQEIFEKIVKQKLDECFQGRVVEYELRYTYPKLGERDLLISYFPIEGPGGVERAACILRDITERKQAEEALRQAEQKYRNIFENAGEGIFQSTPGGQYIAANPALARMHGFDSPEELIRTRKDISREIYADQNRREEFKRLLEENGIVRGFEHQAFRKDGSKIWISVNARSVRDERGTILYYEGTAQDINERKRAEGRSAAFAKLARKLSGARTQLDAGRIIAQTAGDLFGWDSCDLNLYDADRDLVHQMLNIDMIDGQQTEVTGVVSDRKPTARSRRVIDHGAELRLREEPVQFDADAIPFGDKTRPSASMMTVPIRHAARVIGLLSIQSYTAHSYDTAALNDLEALADHCGEALNRIRAEEGLRESEERYRDLVENSRELICTHDLDGLILSANRAAVDLLGYDPKEYCGKRSIRDILAPEVRHQFDEYMARLSKDGATSGIMLVQTMSGERRVWEYYNSLRTEGVATPIVRGMARDITEQRRAEKAMSDLRRELELTMNSMEEGIHRVDMQGNIAFENPAAARMLGWEVAELLGKPAHLTMHHTRQAGTPYPREECPIQASLRDGITRQVADEVFWRRDGTSFPVEYMTAAMRNDRNEIVATVVTFRDITERRRAEAALRESEQEQRLFNLATNDMFWKWDFATDRVVRSIGFERAFGYSEHEITPLIGWWEERLHPDDQERVLTAFQTALKRGDKTCSYEYHFRRHDGSYATISDRAYIVRDENGKAVRAMGAMTDITERKRAEKSLRESEERYRELFENAKDAIYVHDLSGRYISVNCAAEKLSGYTREEILGKHFSNFVSPRDLKQVRTNLCRKLDEENETIYEVDLVTRAGRRVPVEVSSRLIYENGVAIGVQGTARDITDRKRAQEALHIYSQRLIQAQEAESEKIARELHDQIGQVLTAVRINLQSIQRSCRTEGCVHPLNESIGIVDEALGCVRELSIELRPSLLDDLGLPAALRWYVDRYAQRTGIIAEVLNGFEEDGRLPRELETVCFRIAQEALTNVARHAQAGSVSVQLERSRERMLLTIIDDGVGFDIDNLRKSASAASALGLLGMEERALAVGGYIEIDSGSGRGTRVRATFPLKRK
jgi:PAS domain S-box-containing protein